jgi:hemerythrin-like domain-containing protein
MIKEPLQALQDCHCRIEEQLRALETLAENPAAAQSAPQAVLHYFDTSGALHHQDEDEDLFPLLRRRAGALGRSEVAAAIEELEREHATMDAQWRRLRQALKGEAIFDKDEVERFAWLYRRHMDRESALVLPFANEVLGKDERTELGARMAARRAA